MRTLAIYQYNVIVGGCDMQHIFVSYSIDWIFHYHQ